MESKLLKLGISLWMIFAFVACKQKQTTAEKPAPIPVQTALVSQNDIKEYLNFNGVTQYQKKEDIRANVTGYISWLPFEIGDRIKAGQTFASVRTKEQEALAEAIKIDSSLAKFSKPIRISSNASGIIRVLNVNTNDYIAEGDILATIAQPKTLVVKLNVPFEEENSLKIGTTVEIILPGARKINAKITNILPQIDPNVQTQTYLIALPKQDLPENLNVQVKVIKSEDSTALSIPKTALQTNELLTKYWVMKVVHDSLAIKYTVKPLLQNDSLVQIESATVKLGDRLVTEGSYQMQDSTLVSIQKK